MAEQKMVLPGFCGVDCAACPDLLAKKCSGCRETVWPDDDPYPPTGCCWNKSISCCGECPDFPCPMMAEFYEENESHRQAFRRMRQVFGTKRKEIGGC